MQIPCESCCTVFELNDSLIKDTGSMVRCSKCQKAFRVYPPKSVDPRKSPRVKTRNLISYFSFDKTGKLISDGLGVSLGISEDGILLETPENIESGMLVLVATDNENNLIEVKGKIIYRKKASTGMYQSGIKFIGVEERVTKFIAALIREYNYRRKNLFLAVKQKNKTLNLPLT